MSTSIFFDANGNIEFYRLHKNTFLTGNEYREFIYTEGHDSPWKQIQVVWKENEIAFIDFYLH